MLRPIYKEALAKTIEYTKNGRNISILTWIQQQIELSPDNTIRMRYVDIVRALGPEFENKRYPVIVEGLKRALANYGIDIKSRTHKKDESQVLMMLPIKYEHDKRV